MSRTVYGRPDSLDTNWYSVPVDVRDVEVLVQAVVVDREELAVRAQDLVAFVVVRQARRGVALLSGLEHEQPTEGDVIVDGEAAVVEVERVGPAVVLADERLG